jgi:hypothetical protein
VSEAPGRQAPAFESLAGTEAGPSGREGRSIEQLEEWAADGEAEATDGCWVEPDGICEHGKKSWLLVLGLI